MLNMSCAKSVWMKHMGGLNDVCLGTLRHLDEANKLSVGHALVRQGMCEESGKSLGIL